MPAALKEWGESGISQSSLQEIRSIKPGHLAGFLAADQITTLGDQRLATLRPERRDDVAVRAPQSKPAMVAFSSLSVASQRSVTTAPKASLGKPLRQNSN